jgi:hypothetical protein
VIGALQSAADGVSTDPPSDDFVLALFDASLTPTARFFGYGQIASGSTFVATENFSLSPTQMPPIPAPTSVREIRDETAASSLVAERPDTTREG